MTDPPGLTDPLPLGWHRLTWRRKAFVPEAPPLHVVTSEGPSITLLVPSLEKDPDVVPGSIKTESWDGTVREHPLKGSPPCS